MDTGIRETRSTGSAGVVKGEYVDNGRSPLGVGEDGTSEIGWTCHKNRLTTLVGRCVCSREIEVVVTLLVA